MSPEPRDSGTTTRVSAGRAASGWWAACGAWAFRNRSWLPVPVALSALLLPVDGALTRWLWPPGLVLIAAGTALRLWAVRHIGVVSRTRAARLGHLILTGPYAWTRNPLYVGNFLLWTGFGLCAEVPWILPFAWIIFALQYSAIVRWEEHLLAESFPTDYSTYAAKVRRWWPSLGMGHPSETAAELNPWSAVLFSERGTFVAVGALMVVILAKRLLLHE